MFPKSVGTESDHPFFRPCVIKPAGWTHQSAMMFMSIFYE